MILYRKITPGKDASYREATRDEIVEVLLHDEALRAALFKAADTRESAPVLPWDEVEGPRWVRATERGPVLAWVFELTARHWAFRLDSLASGVTSSREGAMLLADAALRARGWTLS